MIITRHFIAALALYWRTIKYRYDLSPYNRHFIEWVGHTPIHSIIIKQIGQSSAHSKVYVGATARGWLRRRKELELFTRPVHRGRELCMPRLRQHHAFGFFSDHLIFEWWKSLWLRSNGCYLMRQVYTFTKQARTVPILTQSFVSPRKRGW